MYKERTQSQSLRAPSGQSLSQPLLWDWVMERAWGRTCRLVAHQPSGRGRHVASIMSAHAPAPGLRAGVAPVTSKPVHSTTIIIGTIIKSRETKCPQIFPYLLSSKPLLSTTQNFQKASQNTQSSNRPRSFFHLGKGFPYFHFKLFHVGFKIVICSYCTRVANLNI